MAKSESDKMAEEIERVAKEIKRVADKASAGDHKGGTHFGQEHEAAEKDEDESVS